MKKWCLCHRLAFILIILLLVPFAFYPHQQVIAESDIHIVIYGDTLYTDVPPIISNGRTMVPMSSIFYALGAQVSWDPVYQEITGRRGSDIIVLQINNNLASVNGTVLELDAAPFIYRSRTMVPAAFIAQSLGETVQWDPVFRTVSIGEGSPKAILSGDEAISRVIVVADLGNEVSYLVDSQERRNGTDYYIIKAYVTVNDGGGYSHTSTVGWYYVDMYDGSVYEWNMSDDSISYLG